MKPILPNFHQLKLGAVNAYLIDHGGLTLIDTGYPGNEEKIFDYLKKIGETVAPFYENLEQGYRDINRLGVLEFDAAVFGHGNPVIGGAAEKFRKKLTTKQLKPEYHA